MKSAGTFGLQFDSLLHLSFRQPSTRFCVIRFVSPAANMTTRQTPKGRHTSKASAFYQMQPTSHSLYGTTLSFPPSPRLGDEAICHHRCLIENARIRLHKTRRCPPKKQVSLIVFREASVTRSSFNPLQSLLYVVSIGFYCFLCLGCTVQTQASVSNRNHVPPCKRLAINSTKIRGLASPKP